ncbi:GGDEF domain-containing protein [Persephonella sp. KM09-Lau-8]|uniref:GGDEF domain-containing protein n=1 Tax=Persephonella sp. KM09-Lau-8 TaxID=1158345 RepID=UPI00068AE5EA|nr:GGDEF domain-containing protein [Persephonella sp. KM09-Lau-8]
MDSVFSEDVVNKVSSKTLSYMVENDIPITPSNYSKWYKVFSYMEKNKDDSRSPQELYFALNRDINNLFEVGNLFLSYKDKTNRIVSTIEGLIFTFDAIYKALEKEKSEGYASPYLDFVYSKLRLIDKTFLNLRDLLDSLKETANLFENDLNKIIEEFSIDPLTGVYTRKAFFDYFSKMFSATQRNSEYKFSLILVDIDYFKSINDTYGHDGGDTVLKEVGRLLKDSVRAEDFVGRIGGEEFGIILNFNDSVYACKVAERIRMQIEQHPFIIKKKTIINITASFGVVDSNGFSSTKEMYSACDSLLYSSKKQGRNRVTCRL